MLHYFVFPTFHFFSVATPDETDDQESEFYLVVNPRNKYISL